MTPSPCLGQPLFTDLQDFQHKGVKRGLGFWCVCVCVCVCVFVCVCVAIFCVLRTNSLTFLTEWHILFACKIWRFVFRQIKSLPACYRHDSSSTSSSSSMMPFKAKTPCQLVLCDSEWLPCFCGARYTLAYTVIPLLTYPNP